MPIVARHDTGDAVLLVWKATEGEDELRPMVTAGDRASADRFLSPKRRLEHLAWRAALRTVLPGGEVAYGDTCAPFVEGAGVHISATHSGGYAAVLVAKSLCAVDMEPVGRDLADLRCRFLTEREQGLPDSVRPDFPVAVWCAKEALYKYSGRRELDFLKDLEIVSSDIGNGTMEGRLCNTAPIPLRLFRYEGYIIVYIV